ncbi:MAG TPA: hypothetical protein PLV05_05505 [Verrucomicrobiota bacterium]|jgi:hypothetical protein|nr:hypothetical protein [Verrucomicrobiota bacterium]OQC25140.1 MAG: hypothetical protein BWX68_01697 [Verrucomicrobia bacterium ADurb.Bin063]HCL92402.1 hypothetical protein [Limisphaerales bacterium]HRR64042.1 hypothetical protein [Candidatus Paceibacterota bacterium]MBP8015542.1 hypothetical protein [Verrucomicrobiota bacterium]
MTKLIAVLIIVGVIYGTWELFLYWEKVKNEEETRQKQDAAALVMGDQLPGLPYDLQESLQVAQKKGAAGLEAWLKVHGQSVEDPRKAWIELDYCVAVARENPAEARRVFARVKERLTASSPVWARMKQLEKTYQ